MSISLAIPCHLKKIGSKLKVARMGFQNIYCILVRIKIIQKRSKRIWETCIS